MHYEDVFLSVFSRQAGLNERLDALRSSSETLSVSGHLHPTGAVPRRPAGETPRHQGAHGHLITETHLQ